MTLIGHSCPVNSYKKTPIVGIDPKGVTLYSQFHSRFKIYQKKIKVFQKHPDKRISSSKKGPERRREKQRSAITPN
jgi:hypothetical protein